MFKDENLGLLYETRISQIFNVEVTRLEFKNILDNHILGNIEDYGWIPKVTRLEWLKAGFQPQSMSLYAASMVAGKSRTGVLPAYLSQEWLRLDPVTNTEEEISKGFAQAREYYSHLLGSEEFNKRLSNVIFKIRKRSQKNYWQALKRLKIRIMNLESYKLQNLYSMLKTRNKMRGAK
ncbi:hypothetical protein CROQUDRAFT_89807 [Cronartium quercuum f. sp. fusiforme G11]|uniref:Uncharacterized protein n=1 Tax=Cronartium quercuum f. sp. fusiforme G11 TaxID=708437 RepID=A0A9P6TDW5_9BASI|nr:hypothetical protein CROQUDRAFT_89807 [Cronartium quercuum f. sp. fusiforme G11]